MATQSRTADSDVKTAVVRRRLRSAPWEFRFFQAMRLMMRILPERGHIGKYNPPYREIARLKANPNTAFPASEIQELVWNEEGPVELTVNFMGMFGPMGALPLYYSQYIAARLRARDTGVAAFLDLFNHRMISLFYQAWEKYRFFVAYERGERDRMTQYLLDSIGMGTPGLQNRLDVRDESLVYYSGLLSLLPRSALALEQILSDYFDVPVRVEQFVGAWYPLEPKSQCQFQEADGYSEQLGVGVIVGDEVWDPQSGARIVVGPLRLVEYLDFLPEGSAYKPLRSLARHFSNGEISFEIQLVLRRDEVPQVQLGAIGEAGPRLGWVTWVKNLDLPRDPDETVLRI